MPTAKFGIWNLPIDLILEIFFILSTKDLFCCMSVCKSWYNLITNPNFTANYTRNLPFPTVLLACGFSSRKFFLVEIHPSGEFTQKPIKPKIPDHSETESFLSVIGFLDGLLFLLLSKRHDLHNMREQVYFCNPLFGGCFKLGDYKIVDKGNRFTQYVLGLVPSTSQFKLLRIVFEKDRRLQEAHVFTVGEDDEWRILEEPLSPLARFDTGTSFNGVYYCFDENGDCMHTFDFGTEKGGQIPGPPSSLPNRLVWKRLSVMGNSLCVIETPKNLDRIIILILGEYRGSWSWSKKILLQNCFPGELNMGGLIPVEVLQNGDILFTHFWKNSLVFFNRETKRCTEIKVCDSYRQSYATVYAPRFYSIQRDVARGRYGTLEMYG
ncbi:hypothetical protein CDL12_29716 [Handroanthus impetiginosus]|uniref:F-box domain-containing protein n=1 Tax=Handroanthus impetiginosus TaxID=429701 RepID=A0A2G9FYS1_9LAMI|nr:hypothetical protein CDL12_29716 [Handroanthus impetiginosus]